MRGLGKAKCLPEAWRKLKSKIMFHPAVVNKPEIKGLGLATKLGKL